MLSRLDIAEIALRKTRRTSVLSHLSVHVLILTQTFLAKWTTPASKMSLDNSEMVCRRAELGWSLLGLERKHAQFLRFSTQRKKCVVADQICGHGRRRIFIRRDQSQLSRKASRRAEVVFSSLAQRPLRRRLWKMLTDPST